jgi:hypothetical protein
MKTILATILAGSFLLSVPSIVRADEKGDKSEKKEKKADKGDKGKKDDAAKTGGGW